MSATHVMLPVRPALDLKHRTVRPVSKVRVGLYNYCLVSKCNHLLCNVCLPVCVLQDIS